MPKNDLKFVDYVPETVEEEYAVLVGRVEATATYIDYCCQQNKPLDGSLLLMMLLGTSHMEHSEFLKVVCPF